MKRKTVYFQDNIVFLRQVKRYSAQQMANKLDIPLKRYQSYEEGRAFPKIDLLYNMADFHGETIESLCFDREVAQQSWIDRV